MSTIKPISDEALAKIDKWDLVDIGQLAWREIRERLALAEAVVEAAETVEPFIPNFEGSNMAKTEHGSAAMSLRYALAAYRSATREVKG